MNSDAKNFDIIVIGRGITGVSAAWHLKQRGHRRIGIIGPRRTNLNCLSLTSSFATSGLIDNVTRINHQYGPSTAKQILELGAFGFAGLAQFGATTKTAWSPSVLRRMATSEHELEEMSRAVEILRSMNLAADLIKTPSKMDTQGIFAVQMDCLDSASLDAAPILHGLEEQSEASVIEGTAHSLAFSPKGVSINCGGQKISCEMVVVAAHLGSGYLLPNLKSAMIPYSDQVVTFSAKEDGEKVSKGALNIIHHGNYVFWKDYNGLFHISGARFMRPMAGIDAVSGEVVPEITKHLLAKAAQWFELQEISVISTRALLECRPCDELPVIGPMYGETRALIAAGYSGAGMALGFAAGDVLAEFISTGTSRRIPLELQPQRLRSM